MNTMANKQKSTQNLNIRNSIEVTIISVARGPAPLNRNAINDKNVTKKSRFVHFQFLLALLRTTVYIRVVLNLKV